MARVSSWVHARSFIRSTGWVRARLCQRMVPTGIVNRSIEGKRIETQHGVKEMCVIIWKETSRNLNRTTNRSIECPKSQSPSPEFNHSPKSSPLNLYHTLFVPDPRKPKSKISKALERSFTEGQTKKIRKPKRLNPS